jgi:hypothetical protein
MLNSVLKNQQMVRITHTLVELDSIDFSSKSFSLSAEYHVHFSKLPADPPPGGPAAKCLAVAFGLPDGIVDVDTVTVNGVSAPSLSPLEEVNNVSNFSLSYTCFPEGSCTNSLGEIFARMCMHRRDLISFEEISKAHHMAAIASGQAYGLVIKIPPSDAPVDMFSIRLTMRVSSSPLFRKISDTSSDLYLLAMGNECWFPIPWSIVTLPNGVSATRQPIEHQRHRVTVSVGKTLVPVDHTVAISGDKLSDTRFESSWINPRTVGLFIGKFVSVTQRSVFHALAVPSAQSELRATLESSDAIAEITQVLSPWFACPAQPLPQINIIFLPLAKQGDYIVLGNTLVFDQSVLSRPGFIERQMETRLRLAEGVAALWIARAMPSFCDVWIPVGMAAMLALRVIEFSSGLNDYSSRVHDRRSKYHTLVERGLDWRPLPLIADQHDPVLRVKAGLVFEAIRRGLVPDADLRVAFHELASVEFGKKGPVNSEAFFFHLICTVGQHTESGSKLPKFAQDWVHCCGVPVIHIGFSLLDKKRFQVHVTQRPLQRVSPHDLHPLCQPGTAQSDFVCRRDEPGGGATYLRPHLGWPDVGRRRFWSGPIDVSIFRAAGYRVGTTIEMTAFDANSANEGNGSTLTIPFVTPRKNEMSLNRTAREDELVHGWVTVVDENWFMAKIITVQSPLMWSNQLQFSRNFFQEMQAVEALGFVRGSSLVQEVLLDALTRSAYSYRVRQEAGKALAFLALRSGEREALLGVFSWIQREFVIPDWSIVSPRDWLTFLSVAEVIATGRRNVDKRDAKTVFELLVSVAKSVERSVTVNRNRKWKVNPDSMLAGTMRLVVLVGSMNDEREKQIVQKTVTNRVKSDLYGPPLASENLAVLQSILTSPIGLFPFLNSSVLESIASSHPLNRSLSRVAIRAYLVSLTGPEPGVWLIRLKWVIELAKLIIQGERINSLHAITWVVDSLEFLADRFKREVSSKSPVAALLQQKETINVFWDFLTRICVKLPSFARSHVTQTIVSLYQFLFGTGVPMAFNLGLSPQGLPGAPMSFWLPFKEHERAYKRMMIRGPGIKMDSANRNSATKRPRLLIAGLGAIPLGDPEEKTESNRKRAK